MKSMEEKIKNILERGAEDIVGKEEIEKKLREGEKLRVKFGLDPTGTNIHLGGASQFWRLKAFQDLGHQVVFIIGDFTAKIGDASDKQEMRKNLTDDEIADNMKDYKEQISKILDMDKIEIRYNSEWFNDFDLKKLIPLAMEFTSQQMIQRRNFKERWDQEKPIGLHELLYPLLQGYDSVAVKADVEIGGFDQLFNLKAGRKIQRFYKQKPQYIITSKMLYGLDGREMSTSWGNVVNINEKAKEMYGKVMSIQDDLIIDYFELCAFVDYKELEEIRNRISKGKINPRDAKADLAFRIVKLYHGEEEAEEAAEHFERVFCKKENPEEIEEVEIKKEKMSVLDLLSFSGMISSRAEGKRLVNQRGVKINEDIIEDPHQVVEVTEGMIIKIGKRKFKKVI